MQLIARSNVIFCLDENSDILDLVEEIISLICVKCKSEGEFVKDSV